MAHAWSVVALGVFWLVLRAEIRIENPRVSWMWVRFAAFVIDFFFALAAIVPIMELIPLIAESRRTGTFSWRFERDYTVPSDALQGIVFVLVAGWVLFYFLYPLMRGKPTIAGYLLRLAVIGEADMPLKLTFKAAVQRIFLAFSAFGVPWKTIRTRRKNGQTWYDERTGLRVVRY